MFLFESIKNKKNLKKQITDDVHFLSTEPSSSSIISEITTNSSTINTIKVKKNALNNFLSLSLQCQENNVDVLSDLILNQNLIKNETDINSSELLNLMTKILATSNNNFINNTSNIQCLSKEVVFFLN